MYIQHKMFHTSAILLRNISCIGMLSGVSLGCLFNNTVGINIKSKAQVKYRNVPLPIISGFLFGTLLPLSFLVAPLSIINTVGGFTIGDKFIDKYLNEYDVEIKRYHQYGNNNSKYDYPSFILINVSQKDLDNKND